MLYVVITQMILKESQNPTQLHSYGLRVYGLKTFLNRYAAKGIDGVENYPKLERIFLLWVLSQVFFPDASSVTLIGFLEDLSKAPNYDWDSAILAELYISLGECSSKDKDNLN